MESFFEAVDFFIYPLGLCSILSVAILLERLWALRKSQILPAHHVEAFFEGAPPTLADSEKTVVGRILSYRQDQQPKADELKAFASFEVTRLERGMFVLDIVVGAAPLLGLLGTVWGLYRVFNGFTPESGLPEPSEFVQNLGLALTTTMLGLLIALPALIGNIYLQRRVDNLAAEIEVGVERLCRNA